MSEVNRVGGKQRQSYVGVKVMMPHIARTAQDTKTQRQKDTRAQKKRRQVKVGGAVTIGIAPASQLPQDTLFQP